MLFNPRTYGKELPYSFYPWDVAAGLVIADAAGAALANTDSEPYTLCGTEERSLSVETTGEIQASILEQLSRNDRLSE